MKLKNKVALITGGSRGIGRGISIALAKEGAKVAVNYRDDDKSAFATVRKIQQLGGTAIAVKANVVHKPEIDRLVNEVVKKWGKIDILVNNAGVAPFVDIFTVTEQVWDTTMSVNMRAIFFVSQAVAKVMVAKKVKGRIVNITSISGEKATNPLQIPYCTSKGGANMLTKVLALALAPYKITVNAILPGTIETDINRKILADHKVRNGIIESTPLHCLGEPVDIAVAVVYFASDESKWTTGALLPIDGGFIA